MDGSKKKNNWKPLKHGYYGTQKIIKLMHKTHFHAIRVYVSVRQTIFT